MPAPATMDGPALVTMFRLLLNVPEEVRDRAIAVVEQAGEILVLVAGQHDDIVQPGHPREQPPARRFVGDPGVHVEHAAAVVPIVAIDRHHHDLLGEAVPARRVALRAQTTHRW